MSYRIQRNGRTFDIVNVHTGDVLEGGFFSRAAAQAELSATVKPQPKYTVTVCSLNSGQETSYFQTATANEAARACERRESIPLDWRTLAGRDGGTIWRAVGTSHSYEISRVSASVLPNV